MVLRKARLKKPGDAISTCLNHGKRVDMKCSNDTGIQALEVEHDDVPIQTGQRIKHITARAMHDGFLIDYRRDKPRSVQFRQVKKIKGGNRPALSVHF